MTLTLSAWPTGRSPVLDLPLASVTVLVLLYYRIVSHGNRIFDLRDAAAVCDDLIWLVRSASLQIVISITKDNALDDDITILTAVTTGYACLAK